MSVSRFALRTLPMVVLAAITLLVGSNPQRVTAQDPDLKPNFGSKKLKVGFDPDPFKIEVIAGGDVETNKGDLKAWVSKAPDFSIDYTAGELPLTFYVHSKVDTTLLINLPNGTWIADDDSGGNLDPQIKIKTPKSGRYDIWVGTVAKGKAAKATLYVTELEVKKQ